LQDELGDLSSLSYKGKKQMRNFDSIALVAVSCMIVTVAVADEIPCSAANPITNGSTVKSHVVVPDGQLCELTGVSILGKVSVGIQSTLKVHGGVIRGGIEANQCAEVLLRGEATPLLIAGDIEIRNCTGKLDYGNRWVAASIDGSSNLTLITGDVECVGNSGVCQIFQAQVAGNVRVNGSTANGTPAQNTVSAMIAKNLIGGRLDCNGNSPVPTTSGPNLVAGRKRGQCAAAGF
jgi:hypothetical protein